MYQKRLKMVSKKGTRARRQLISAVLEMLIFLLACAAIIAVFAIANFSIR